MNFILHWLIHKFLEDTWEFQPSNYCLVCGYPYNELFSNENLNIED